MLHVSHLRVFEFSEAEIGAAVLVIKAEETKQQISRLNNEVIVFWRCWVLTLIQGMLEKTKKILGYDKCAINYLEKLDGILKLRAVWGYLTVSQVIFLHESYMCYMLELKIK